MLIENLRKRKRGDHITKLEEKHLLQLERHVTHQQCVNLPSTFQPSFNDFEDLPASENDEGSAYSPVLDNEPPQAMDESIMRSDDLPLHISQANRDIYGRDEFEKSQRTVFLANVAITAATSKAAKKQLLEHLNLFNNDSGVYNPEYAVESLRFRSTPFRDSRLPRKAAFAKRALMQSTAKSTHAYAVYRTSQAADAAVERLNGSVVLTRHLRADSVAHPAKQDHLRCVFVGNLGFVDDETAMKEADYAKGFERKGKVKQDADVSLISLTDSAFIQ